MYNIKHAVVCLTLCCFVFFIIPYKLIHCLWYVLNIRSPVSPTSPAPFPSASSHDKCLEFINMNINKQIYKNIYLGKPSTLKRSHLREFLKGADFGPVDAGCVGAVSQPLLVAHAHVVSGVHVTSV